MNNLIDLDDFYEEYRKNNYYLKYNQLLIVVAIISSILLVVLLYLMLYFRLNIITTIIELILIIKSVEVIMQVLLISKIYNEGFFKCFKYDYKEIQKIKEKRKIRADKIIRFDSIIDSFNIKKFNDLQFMYGSFQQRLSQKQKENKTFVEILNTITVVISIANLISKTSIEGELAILIYMLALLGYYSISGIIYS